MSKDARANGLPTITTLMYGNMPALWVNEICENAIRTYVEGTDGFDQSFVAAAALLTGVQSWLRFINAMDFRAEQGFQFYIDMMTDAALKPSYREKLIRNYKETRK